jgi:hypothetical protein
MDWLIQTGEFIDRYLASLGELPKATKDVIAIALIVLGGLFCFIGYRFFKYVLGLSGFLVGGLLGMAFYLYIPVVGTMGDLGRYLTAAAAGAVGAVAFYFLFYYFGIFVFGAAAAMWAAMLALPMMSAEMRLLIVLGFGFVGGLLALLLRRQIVIIFTAAVGAVTMMSGIGYFYNWPLSFYSLSLVRSFDGTFIPSLFDHSDGVLIIVLTTLLFFGGMMVQNFIPEKKREKK